LAHDTVIQPKGRSEYIRHNDERILTLNTTRIGYVEALLFTGDKNHKKHIGVHRLVMMTFNPVENMAHLDVNHIDEDKSNNHIDNLEWVSHKSNCNYGARN
jgi:hypothetical protein